MDEQKLSEDDLRAIALHEYLAGLGRPATVDEMKAAMRILREKEAGSGEVQPS